MNESKAITFVTAFLFCAVIPGRATFISMGAGPTNDTSGYTPAGFTFLEAASSGGGNPPLNVSVDSEVLRGDTSNPLGGLTFLYQIKMYGGSLIQLSLSGFGGPGSVVSVADTRSFGNLAPGLSADGTAPTSVDWLNTLDFNWAPGALGPTNNTDLLVVDTAATGYEFGVFASLNAGADPGLHVLVPTPEPASCVLLGLGAAFFLGCRRRT